MSEFDGDISKLPLSFGPDLIEILLSEHFLYIHRHAL